MSPIKEDKSPLINDKKLMAKKGFSVVLPSKTKNLIDVEGIENME